jgi:NADP-dependent 3-hydroxy acid dehydrogenase YdfG
MLLGPFGSGQRADYRQMIEVVEPGVVATELPDHITRAGTRQGVQQLYNRAEVTAEDVAEIIAFILSRPRRLAINEILLRPAGQQ